MPLQGTLAALLTGMEKQRIIIADTVLTPADLGSIIIVDVTAGDINITLPPIRGNAALTPGQNAIGRGGSILIIRAEGGVGDDAIIGMGGGATPDTFNNGQAGPMSIVTDNGWALFISDGADSGAGDWKCLSVL